MWRAGSTLGQSGLIPGKRAGNHPKILDLDSRAGLGLFVVVPRQRLSTEERERRLDEAVTRFVGDAIALDYAADAVLERLAGELATCAPRKNCLGPSSAWRKHRQLTLRAHCAALPA